MDGTADGRWAEIARILDEILELPEEERDGALARLTGGDPPLGAEVEALLRAEREAGAFLEEPAGSFLSGPVGESPFAEGAPPPGTRIGPFEVVRPIGRGGMGEVVLARRVYGQFDQEVAIKLVRGSFLTDEAHRRFLRERRILARLRHPHVASLVDGGVGENGVPWFAMEYVRGEPITAWCETRGIPIEERLRLFLQVLDAVEHAHHLLVVHRDLKPANILVTEDGRVKLLDFGIAKLLAPDEEDEPEPLATRTSMRILTPGYAAPEQAAGEPITAATDVFALGLVLYELLAGRRAYAGLDTSPASFARALLETEPERPSRAVAEGSAALRKRIAGDLDAIVLKALRREPGERYPSVEALRQDVHAYLESRPVGARRGTAAYRLRKALRRRRIEIVAGVAIAASLTGGFVVSVVQARVAAAERDHARAAEARASALNEFLVRDLLEAPSPEQSLGRALTVKEVLDAAARSVGTAFAGSPRLEASVRLTLARTYSSLGLLPAAREHVDAAVALLGAGDDPEIRRGRLLSAEIAIAEGRFGEARHELESLAATLPTTPDDFAVETALGRVLDLEGEHAAAEARLRRAWEALAAVPDETWRERVETGLSLADALVKQRKLDEADRVVSDAIAILTDRLGPEHPAVAEAIGKRASVLERRLRYRESEPLRRRALDLSLRIHGEDHPDTAQAMADLAVCLERMFRYDEQESWMRRAHEVFRRTLGPDHPRTVQALMNVGIPLRQRGRFAEAEPIYREVYERSRAALGDESPQTIRALRNLNILEISMGKRGDARETARRVRDVYERLVSRTDADPVLLDEYARFLIEVDPDDARDPERALALAERAVREAGAARFYLLDTLARAQDANGDLDGAIETQRRATALAEAAASHAAERTLILLLEKKGDPAAIEAFLVANLEHRRMHRPADDHLIGQTAMRLGEFYVSRERWSEARARLEEALSQYRRTLPETDWRIGWSKSLLAECALRDGRAADAEPLLREAWETLRADHLVREPYLIATRDRLSRASAALGRTAEADRWRRIEVRRPGTDPPQ